MCPRHFIHERHGKTRKEKKDSSTTQDMAQPSRNGCRGPLAIAIEKAG